MKPVCDASPCSHSISRRLSLKLSLFTALVLGALSITSWVTLSMLIKEHNDGELALRAKLVAALLAVEARAGGQAQVLARVSSDAPMRTTSRLELLHADGRTLYADPMPPAIAASRHVRTIERTVDEPTLPGGGLRLRYAMDFGADAEMGRRWALLLTLVTLAATGVVAIGARWHVRRQLEPLRRLASQTNAISPQSLHQRLALADPAEELRPWIEQFNALMARLEQAYAQLEGFNADVAHELRTPLATLIGETEVALSRERGAESLRETLVSNLEEMQRLSAMVSDMLFLSNADRGAVARRGAPVSLAALVRQVCEFHEAAIDDAGLKLRIDGDAVVPVDEPLFKRALSNLLGNATRFAAHGSTVVVRIAPDAAEQVEVVVQNDGEPIAPQQLPRLFDRFFRGDDSRCCPTEPHHGLGLAIVAAIARMHAGRTLAESAGGVTRVGFTLAAA